MAKPHGYVIRRPNNGKYETYIGWSLTLNKAYVYREGMTRSKSDVRNRALECGGTVVPVDLVVHTEGS